MIELPAQLRDLLRRNPSGTAKDIENKMWALIRDDDDVFQHLFHNWFVANFARLEVRQTANSVAVVGRSYPERTATKAAKKEIVKSVVVSGFALMLDYVLDNAHKLTFHDLAKAGGRCSALAKLGKPNEIVGKKLTEQQIRNVWGRNQ